MAPFISIIVPVYNSEKTLHRCIDSVINQSMKDWELLLIDDGSKDTSGEICDEYAAKDYRIKVFHKENGGVSSARNLGLDNSIGKWVTFIDSDDWIVNSALDIDCAKFNEDLLLFSYYSVSSGVEKLKTIDEYVLSDKEELDSFISKFLIYSILKAPWSKLFKRVKIGSIRFDENVRLGEDVLFMFDFLGGVESCRVFNNIFYVYNEGENSLSSKYRLSIEEAIYAMEKQFQSYDKLTFTNEQVEKYIFLDYKSYCYNDICKRPNLWFKNESVRKFYNRIKKYLDFNYKLRYNILSYNFIFRLIMFFRNKVD